ncbi:ABC transporter ATP-binding protein [Luteimonas sp. 3794]|uniref:ABC transporter ATP-binding protein n=1 Tax=Luteimonas sp. 3794 TaxID=2817730 RepID=UPI00285B8BAC|nr:ABC transporter ATP-binding protein [Luteimonas sp. 3794]MDR6991844.1 lipopolysaccharide transport system ATP-binding protein [Luteimonas sp. 3794]
MSSEIQHLETAHGEFVVDAQGLGKCYRVYAKPVHRLLQGLVGVESKRYFKEFWALRGVDLQVRHGETVGVVGRNGSGKSTLLQLLAGTLAPTEGQVKVHGRVAALLELGSGFNPEFTGRENVYLNAAVLGLDRREIEAKLDAILAFADIGEFIDQPVRNYSSGMVVRLAFAVQAQVDPQLLIVDEALAVGDARFQAKCFARLRQLKDAGTAILLVSHSADQIVQHCDRAHLLDGGRQLLQGRPKDVVNHYYDVLFGVEKDEVEHEVDLAPPLPAEDTCPAAFVGDDAGFEARPNYNPSEFRWGDRAARIVDFELSSLGRLYPSMVESGANATLALRIAFDREVVRPILGVTVKTAEGVVVYGSNTEYKPLPGWTDSGTRGSVVDIRIRLDFRLADGDYFISVGVASRNEHSVVPHDRRYDSIHVKVGNADFFGMADLGLEMVDVSSP